MRIKDLTGKQFHELTVMSYHGRQGTRRRAMWLCECSCGDNVIVRGENLKSGGVKSCGCLASRSATKHGLRYHPIYAVWQNMKNRCYNKNIGNYKDYGARGISVCEEWRNDPVNFSKWCFEHHWRNGLEIDRKDNDGNYEPGNCRIVSRLTNANNKRIYKSNTSGYVGIYKIGKMWRAKIAVCRHTIHIGSYPAKADAVHARNAYICAFRIKSKVQIIT